MAIGKCGGNSQHFVSEWRRYKTVLFDLYRGFMRRKSHAMAWLLERQPWDHRGLAGQMTVEASIVIPVVLVVAGISINVMCYLGDCSAFDRLAREAIRIHATSPSYHVTPEQAASAIKESLERDFARENLSVEVSVAGESPGFLTYTASLTYEPTLFGYSIHIGSLSGDLWAVRHQTSLTFDPYKPGGLI